MEEIRPDYQERIKNAELISNDKVPFICKKHGEYWQTLKKHNYGNGCPKCGNELMKIKQRRKDYPFMGEIRKDYQEKIKNGEISCTDKIPFICEKHGEYWQVLSKHVSGHDCLKCGIIKRMKKDYPYIDKIRLDYQIKIKNGDIGSRDKVPFICEIHGEHWARLDYNAKYFCPKCFYDDSAKKDYPFMEDIRKDYQEKIKNGEIRSHDKVPFKCEKHGEYWQELNSHNQGSGCPKCNKIISKSEIEVYNFIKEYYPNTINNIRDLLPDRKLELDIYIPELNIGIEYDGLIWHSEKFEKCEYSLLNKTKEFSNINIHVIHILENEWLYEQELTKQKLLFILSNNYNIDEYFKIFGNSNILDLRYFNISSNPFVNNNYTVQKIYEPDYFYVKYNCSFSKDKIKEKLDYNPELTLNENCNINGYYKLYDCGNIEYSKCG
jgi:predicted  nucleic acid-binding Zn-ribbon protein